MQQDIVFHQNNGPHGITLIAEKTGCTVHNFKYDAQISGIKSLLEATPSDLSFLSNTKYIHDYKISKAAAIIVPSDFQDEYNKELVLLKTKNPYHAYALAIDLFYSYAKPQKIGIMASAYISPTAKIGNNCFIGHNVIIEDEAEIGDNSIIESGSLIDFRVKIGKRARINYGVLISHTIIGDDVVILPGAMIGQDGFGFSTDAGRHKKIYHTGRVIIGNDVEIGANSCIDRGSMSDTIIEDFCRIDNLVQIGHNVHVKKGAILVAQVGIAGSSTIGSYCALGGQVGVAGHINIADRVQIAGQGGVIQDITESGAIMGGTPAVRIKDWHRQSIMMKNLIKKR